MAVLKNTTVTGDLSVTSNARVGGIVTVTGKIIGNLIGTATKATSADKATTAINYDTTSTSDTSINKKIQDIQTKLDLLGFSNGYLKSSALEEDSRINFTKCGQYLLIKLNDDYRISESVIGEHYIYLYLWDTKLQKNYIPAEDAEYLLIDTNGYRYVITFTKGIAEVKLSRDTLFDPYRWIIFSNAPIQIGIKIQV